MAEAQRVKVTARENEVVPIKVGETIIVDVVFLDQNDNPAPVDGMPVWTSTNPAVLEVRSIGDGSSAECTGIVTGEAEAVCYADADMGAPVRNIAGRLAFNVSALEATKVVMTPRS